MTIHVNLDNLTIRGPLPKERPMLRHPNTATLDNLLDAIDDGYTEACSRDDGLPDEATWRRVVKIAQQLEAGK